MRVRSSRHVPCRVRCACRRHSACHSACRSRRACRVRRACREHRDLRGFTLIELLVVVAALSILAAIAVPAFFEQLARARRANVQAALLEDAGYMQHYYASHDAFSGTPPPQLPFAQAPRQGGIAYVIAVSVPPGDPSSFTLTATRAGGMSRDPCGDFTVDHLGRRELVAGTFAADRDAARCWR